MTERELPVTVYTPDSSLVNPRKLFCEVVRDLLISREHAWRRVVRDISAQYLAGILWTLILPLASTPKSAQETENQ
jgi:lipopolysaccharide transport system permease protein